MKFYIQGKSIISTTGHVPKNATEIDELTYHLALFIRKFGFSAIKNSLEQAQTVLRDELMSQNIEEMWK